MIDPELQENTKTLIHEHLPRLPEGTDVAAVIIEIATNNLWPRWGQPTEAIPKMGQRATALRSPGSALKPFLTPRPTNPDDSAPRVRSRTAGSIAKDGRRTTTTEHLMAWSPPEKLTTLAERARHSDNRSSWCVKERGGFEKAGTVSVRECHRTRGLALAVGGLEVSLLNLTNAYATLARREPTPVRMFQDDQERQEHLVFSPETSISTTILGRGGMPCRYGRTAAPGSTVVHVEVRNKFRPPRRLGFGTQRRIRHRILGDISMVKGIPPLSGGSRGTTAGRRIHCLVLGSHLHS